jgi:uncharacterized protein YndB with AHSA1/START domain
MATKSKEWGLVITRTIKAPREVVFKAWIDQKLMAQWWGPDGFTNPVCELDVRPGGAIRIDMLGPDSTVYPENLNTITLVGLGKKTKLTVQADVVKSTPAAEGALAWRKAGSRASLISPFLGPSK